MFKMNSSLFFALFAICVSSAIASAIPSNDIPNGGKEVNATSGDLITWYTCTAEGNYPDPRTCDHYIACTTALLAYQMPCAMDHGRRLHYVRNSGPDPAQSRCDYPEVVGCNIDGEETTTEGSGVTDDPTTSTPEKPIGQCKPHQVVGAKCNPLVDCDQCGDCDWHLICVGDKWEKRNCSSKSTAAGTVLVKDKLFWKPDAAPHGGICTHWNDLEGNTQTEYRENPLCKPPCVFTPSKCVNKYNYSNPDLDKGIWSMEPIEYTCPANTVWDQGDRTCTLCEKDCEKCSG